MVDHIWAKADIYWHHGDYPRIIALDRLIAEIDPHFLEPYAVGGWLMESMGDNANAEKFYRLGVANNPDESYAYYNLAAFYMNTLKNYKATIATEEKGVHCKAATVNDWRMLAHAYEKNGQLDEALATWKQIKQLFPNANNVDHNLARVQSLIDNRKAGVTPGQVDL